MDNTNIDTTQNSTSVSDKVDDTLQSHVINVEQVFHETKHVTFDESTIRPVFGPELPDYLLAKNIPESKQDNKNTKENEENNEDFDDYKLELSEEDKEYGFYIKVLNLYQQWYNRTVEPDYPSMIEDTDDVNYTNGSMETFFEFMTDFKNSINNLAMTRTYKLSDFLYTKQDEKYEEYYKLTIDKNGVRKEYASPLALALFIYLTKIDISTAKWDIDIIE